MGNAEIEFNGRRGRKYIVTMRNLHRELHTYRENNEIIMRYQEEIIQSLNMLYRQVNKDSSPRKEANSK
jgi:hypothetical protein